MLLFLWASQSYGSVRGHVNVTSQGGSLLLRSEWQGWKMFRIDEPCAEDLQWLEYWWLVYHGFLNSFLSPLGNKSHSCRFGIIRPFGHDHMLFPWEIRFYPWAIGFQMSFIPNLQLWDFFQGTQEQVRNSSNKRAISVLATEVLLYIWSCCTGAR